MNSKAIAMVSLSVFGTFVMANQLSLPIAERDINTSLKEVAEKEWLKTWHSNELYSTKATYSFHTKLKLEEGEDKEEYSWAQRLVNRAAKKGLDNADVIQDGEFTGKALSHTWCYHEYPLVRLVREYPYVMSDGTYGLSVEGKSKVVQNIISDYAMDKNEVKENISDFFEGIGKFSCTVGEIAGSIATSVPEPQIAACAEGVTTVAASVAMLVPYLIEYGVTGYEISRNYLENNLGKFDKEGRIYIDKNTDIYKRVAKDNEEIMSLANQFSDFINGKSVAIKFQGKDNQSVYDISESPEILTKGAPWISHTEFDKYLNGMKEADGKLASVIKRESFSLNDEIFDHEERKAGDVWVANGNFFNSFLHPDLAGSFSGDVILHYESDDCGDDGYISEEKDADGKYRRYDVMRIRVLGNAVIDGIKRSTTLKYDEIEKGGRFSASYDASAGTTYCLIDKKSHHVVFARVKLESKDASTLPMLPLVEGFRANGKLGFEMKFTGDIHKISDFMNILENKAQR